MKLTDLHPNFVAYGGPGITDRNGNPVPERQGIGLACDCPKCGPQHRMFIPFQNPMDGGPPIETVTWQRTGDTFETMSLTPSIQRLDRCRWHGFITNGEIITV